MRNGRDHILVLDSSTASPFVCLVREGRMVCSAGAAVERSFSQQGMDLILRILQETDLGPTDLSAVACVTGPGSFTGVRIGLAMIKGLLFRTQVPGIALSSLRLFAQLCLGKGSMVCPIIDARMGDVYAAAYDRDGNEVLGARAEPPADFAARLSGQALFCGPNPAAFSSVFQACSGIVPAYATPGSEAYQQAAADVAWKDFEKHIFVPISEMEPVYLRKSYAEMRA
ncbi:MAG: tRNA (adenosine(37)-N6)-threonylcarbamoyltransferase complex dimerization subunit type 1 TsaB [Candidatus Raymondbacteria bacterium RifOxyA12_full_50_37]|uniref:tRNA (Adenosine(37)-N6)-threonylcarbamoyltransferase complex dimerization subunit type 1 TsaB n=1 Tax=Candidatus Raymondbacteria bacterium RIFOXYD12_FULL_49_13 TaxID=1817890 RepID=A0A1F7FD63_UNCRA|nr:MAG: tRNA (adenosine(37)-N6)-threonylcarbamoyltransferase complex dimerization subunit type 1 TsaB [Candidatus Raymondbacteria bacterium RifOxyA12_full_50_37]OGJ86281.1 MAG: tRNA (adenosine(37)-N6)-threonylcarbamoyltransferase complex dimerization subunit type 1 TsaB [Candidatus Raymondbacteria bacterium RIFOXYA2_FULL_49_16]OGJ93615.1 MAG: tRNA (adenosine(37)-N6)-threonylcarbamoyltransferase complex dimerization subunit type 1 TsaB [Candidatus Raymondbacteria bacterium RifOxyC12_full_50_8]OGJ